MFARGPNGDDIKYRPALLKKVSSNVQILNFFDDDQSYWRLDGRHIAIPRTHFNCFGGLRKVRISHQTQKNAYVSD